MTSAAILDEILRLPQAERIKLLDEIWKSLGAADIAIPEWHKEERDRRDAHPSGDAYISVDEMMDRFRSAKK